MHMAVDRALTVATASSAVQRLLVAIEAWLCEQLLWTGFLKIVIQLLRHNVNLGSTLTLGDMVRFLRVNPLKLGKPV
jgi:hypothetical protein